MTRIILILLYFVYTPSSYSMKLNEITTVTEFSEELGTNMVKEIKIMVDGDLRKTATDYRVPVKYFGQRDSFETNSEALEDCIMDINERAVSSNVDMTILYFTEFIKKIGKIGFAPLEKKSSILKKLNPNK